jgi:hypothetical protein
VIARLSTAITPPTVDAGVQPGCSVVVVCGGRVVGTVAVPEFAVGDDDGLAPVTKAEHDVSIMQARTRAQDVLLATNRAGERSRVLIWRAWCPGGSIDRCRPAGAWLLLIVGDQVHVPILRTLHDGNVKADEVEGSLILSCCHKTSDHSVADQSAITQRIAADPVFEVSCRTRSIGRRSLLLDGSSEVTLSPQRDSNMKARRCPRPGDEGRHPGGAMLAR